MKTDFVIKEELTSRNTDISSSLSFHSFFDYLQKHTYAETTVKAKIYQFILDQFKLRPDWKNGIDLDRISEYTFLYELIFATLLAPATDEREIVWGLALPMSPSTFYSTDRLYELMKNNVHDDKRIELLETGLATNRKQIVEGAYALILQRLYGLPVFPTTEVIQGYREVETGLVKYMCVELDLRFTNVTAKRELPDIHIFLPPSGRLDEPTVKVLMEKLPLRLFHFDGFSVIKGKDSTESFVLEMIHEAMMVDDPGDMGKAYAEIFKLLQSLLGTTKIEFGVFPFMRVNQQLVFVSEGRQLSYLVKSAQQAGVSEDDLLLFVDQFRTTPSLFFHTTLLDEETATLPFKILQSEQIKSLVLLPIHYHGELVGIFELHSAELDISDRRLLSRLDHSTALLSQLVHRTVTEGAAYIDRLVKKEFTSLQPSVEWKFKELAWQYIKDCRIGDQQYAIGTVHFHEVFPFYGAIDIRNSTLERSNVLKEDLKVQLSALQIVFSALRQFVPEQEFLSKLERSKMLRLRLDADVMTEDEVDISQFLDVEIPLFLNTLAARYPAVLYLVKEYQKQTHDANGYFFVNRNKLEKSMQLLNTSLAARMHLFQQHLLTLFPNYFESFRTDGIEYDIYLGQSIAPMSPFNMKLVHEFRFSQLAFMVDIVRLAGSLTARLEVPLQTTQLIFVHNNFIDISFRKDERRFDVEGAYNIRYQVMKKRIDKVHIRDTNERLTQPGTVAIVYLKEDSQREYAEHIKRLEEEGSITLPCEYVDLEELQGVRGVKAIRITVTLQ
jgi:hypothetical protein